MLPIQNANTSGGYFLLTGDTKVIDTLIGADHPGGGLWNHADQQIRMLGGEIYSTKEKDTQESGSRLHLIDIPSAQARLGEGNTVAASQNAGAVASVESSTGMSSPRGENDQLWGELITEITYISSLKSVTFDHRAVFENLKRDWANVAIRRRSRSQAEDISENVQKQRIVWGDVELIGVPYIERYIPSDDPNLISKFLCEWPILVIEIIELPNKAEKVTYVLPLDPLEDVVLVSKKFRKELDKYLEHPQNENHFDFSVFSALHVMELLCSHLAPTTLDECANSNPCSVITPEDDDDCDEATPALWIPYIFRSEILRGQLDGDNLPGISGESFRNEGDLVNCYCDISKEILSNPFCAYQFIRYVCITIKNGFENLVDQKPDLSLPFYNALAAIRRNIKTMTICSQIGLRCSYSPVKYAALLMYGVSKKSDHHISHSDLLRLSQYSRVKCDVGNIYPTDPKKSLPIHKLSSFLTNVIEKTPIVEQTVSHSELGSAFERLRQIGNATSSYESVWFQFNADLFYMSTIAHQTMRGEISHKSLSSIWALPKTIDPNVQWLAVFAAGFAFTLELPSRLFEYLENGRLTRELDDIFEDGEDEKEYFLIHMDYKDLPWQDYRERLREMYRVKDSWTKLELCAWLDRCLTKNSEPISDIIQKFLKSRSNTMQFENENLHLEMR